jgi:hypothetical protein
VLALTISSEGHWPFSLVGQVDEEKYSYSPRSDLLFSLGGYPRILVELCSDHTHESDRARLILQAGVLVRVMNSIKPKNKQSFIAVAIYVNSLSVAERYFIYQPDRSTQQVRCWTSKHRPWRLNVFGQIAYFHDNFPLEVPLDAFRFFFELHNLPSALPSDPDLRGAHSHLLQMEHQVRGWNYDRKMRWIEQRRLEC